MVASSSSIRAIRSFNRFYTRLVGALDEGHLDSAFSLAEVRVLYELAHGEALTATDIAHDLSLDAGYLSRLLAALEKKRLVRRARGTDARRRTLGLTAAGRTTAAGLESRASEAVAALLEPLSGAEQKELVTALERVQALLSADNHAKPKLEEPFAVRAHRPGDMGWVVEAHGALYWKEYGWDERFEALVARVVADFIDHFEPEREHCWIAEANGVRVGCVFLVRHPERPGVAKLRLLLVDPSARGLGLGRYLVGECMRFARDAGYHTMTLWTNDVLVSARRIYEAAGFTLAAEERHQSFGKELVAQTWEVAL